jgi:hypothetical protein
MIEPLEAAQVVGGDMAKLDRPPQHDRDGREPIVGLALTRCTRSLVAPIHELSPEAQIVKHDMGMSPNSASALVSVRYAGGITPTLSTASEAAALIVTASQSGFTMLMPIWGTALNAPRASTSIPF